MFPHVIKLVGKGQCDLKYNLENILNPHKNKNDKMINNITEIDHGIFIVTFNFSTGILESLYNHLYKDTEARLIISSTLFYTITLLNEFLCCERLRPWIIEPPFYCIKYGLLYKGRPYINWVVEHTESMEVDYINFNL